jgi:hypothetical protein
VIFALPAVAAWPADCFGPGMLTDCAIHTERRDIVASDVLLERFRSEIRHAPGLALTLAQIARLFNLPPDACERLIRTLAHEGRLSIRPDGRVMPTSA